MHKRKPTTDTKATATQAPTPAQQANTLLQALSSLTAKVVLGVSAKPISNRYTHAPFWTLVDDHGIPLRLSKGIAWVSAESEEAAWGLCPRYAEEIAAAWPLAERYGINLMPLPGKGWQATGAMRTPVDGTQRSQVRLITEIGESAPEAICRCAIGLSILEHGMDNAPVLALAEPHIEVSPN